MTIKFKSSKQEKKITHKNHLQLLSDMSRALSEQQGDHETLS